MMAWSQRSRAKVRSRSRFLLTAHWTSVFLPCLCEPERFEAMLDRRYATERSTTEAGTGGRHFVHSDKTRPGIDEYQELPGKPVEDLFGVSYVGRSVAGLSSLRCDDT
jgi:hypothetical protein